VSGTGSRGGVSGGAVSDTGRRGGVSGGAVSDTGRRGGVSGGVASGTGGGVAEDRRRRSGDRGAHHKDSCVPSSV
jgi:hypothetical protein